MPPEHHTRLSFDARDYRALRIEELRLSAAAAAEKVRHTGMPFPFNPMTSRERRIIHLALRDEPGVRSESTGFGSYRQVVVHAEGAPSAAQRAPLGPARPAVLQPGPPPLSLHLTDTIAAISTPPGQGGLGVLRLSGPQARATAERMLRLSAAAEWRPWTALLAELVDTEGHAGGPGDRHLLCPAPLLYRRRCRGDLLPRLAGGSPLRPGASLPGGRPARRARRVHSARLSQRAHRSAACRGRARPDRGDHALSGEDRRPADAGIGVTPGGAPQRTTAGPDCAARSGNRFRRGRCSRRRGRGDPGPPGLLARRACGGWRAVSLTGGWCTPGWPLPSSDGPTSARAASSTGCWSRTAPSLRRSPEPRGTW